MPIVLFLIFTGFYFLKKKKKKLYCFITTSRSGLHGMVGMLGSGYVWGYEEMMIGKLEIKRVGLEARPKGSSDLLLGMGSHDKGVMASHGHDTKKVKKFLEI